MNLLYPIWMLSTLMFYYIFISRWKRTEWLYISLNYKLLRNKPPVNGRQNAKRLLGVTKIYLTYDLGQKKNRSPKPVIPSCQDNHTRCSSNTYSHREQRRNRNTERRTITQHKNMCKGLRSQDENSVTYFTDVKFSLRVTNSRNTTQWRRMGEYRCSSTILDLGITRRWVNSSKALPLYSWGNRHRYQLYRGVGGPQSRYGRFGNGNTVELGYNVIKGT
jgi:hypothetical protein